MELTDVQINTLTQWCRHSAMTKLMHIKGQKALARNVADEFKSRLVNERKDFRRKRGIRGEFPAERPPDVSIFDDEEVLTSEGSPPDPQQHAVSYDAVDPDADRLDAVVKVSNQAEGDPTQDRLAELLAVINRETADADRGASKVDKPADD
jgi:hypothetical protein